MDHSPLDRLLFLTLLIIFCYSSVSIAATPVVLETGIHFAADGTMYYKPVGTASSVLMYPDLQTTKDVSVNTSKGPQSLTVSRTPKIDLSRVGAAAVNFAKLLGPVGLGISIAQIVCDLSKICSNASGLWEKQADAAVAGWPTTIIEPKSWTMYAYGSGPGSYKLPTPQVRCEDWRVYQNSISPAWAFSAGYTINSISGGNPQTANCVLTNTLNQSTSYQMMTSTACPLNYNLIGGQCQLIGNSVPKPVQDSDWTAAKTVLNDSRFIQPLLDKGEAVPVFLPPAVPTIEKVIDTQTVPTLDAQGNITGSQVTTTKLQAVDASSASSPNTFNITESTTVNNYNTSNVLTSTTTTVTNPPAPTPAAADPVTFDEVSDVPIQQYAVNPNYDSTSWGEGECPAPVEVVTSFGAVTVPTARACDFAVTVKPIVLLLATLAAMFIIAGVRSGEG